jgi:hypothetical protein
VKAWRKSSYGGHEGSCLEVALGPVVGVRDTKARAAGQLSVSSAAWRSVLAVLTGQGRQR